jgi:2-keto-4-pentenoate hydratase/2-oxohepta-3-ene-1,7-dioic acid hydratase in catechol pathway
MDLVKTEFGVGVETPGGLLELRHIIGIGRNYAEHAAEQGADVPDRPMIFTKNPCAACLDGDEIVVPPVCRDPETGGPDQVDYEAELAVVIGRATRDVPEGKALAYVLGYCCANDVTARWWQKKGSGGQFCRGKSFDTFCPLGPSLVAEDEIADVQDLAIRCRVNGETRQEARTSMMMFPVAALIAELSRGTTLAPGTVILTGTPSGVGMARTPPAWLKEGDVVEVEIDGVGRLTNRVRHE